MAADKKSMLLKYKREMVINSKFIDALKRTKELLQEKKWDGKILNKRLSSFLESELKSFPYNMGYVSYRPEYTNRYIYIGVNNDDRSFCDENGKFLGYVESSQTAFQVAVEYKDGNERILLDKTLANIDNDIERLRKCNDELLNLIENFDYYMKRNKEMEEYLRAYEKEVPYRVRPSYTKNEHIY